MPGDFAKHVKISIQRMSHLINGRLRIGSAIAVILSQSVGQSHKYWLDLQIDYDLKCAGYIES